MLLMTLFGMECRMPRKKTGTSAPRAGNGPERIRVEKSLATLGFFSVRGGIPRDKSTERTITLKRTIGGEMIDVSATIIASKKFGFPRTSDQDCYFSILSFVSEAVSRGARIPAMLELSPAELLRRQGKTLSGDNYEDLENQLLRLATTTIVSESAIWNAGKKQWSKDVFRVFDRVLLKGEELEDGTTARRHCIWLSSWQIENFKNGYLLLIDYEKYSRLRNEISRALVPLLQVWLFASRRTGKFEKLYEDLAKILDIKVEQFPADIKKQLGPSLDELIREGYIRDWSIERAVGLGAKRYKIVFHHSKAFLNEIERRAKAQLALPELDDLEGTSDDGGAISEDEAHRFGDDLIAAGIHPAVARKHARTLEREQLDRASRIVEYFRSSIDHAKLKSPPAFLMSLLKADLEAPVEFRVRAAAADVLQRGANPELDAEIERRAVAELAIMRAYEAETDELVSSLLPLELAAINDRAEKLLDVEYPSNHTWSAEARQRQLRVILRRLVREGN